MKNIKVLVILPLIILMLSGCMSATIVSTGKRYKKLIKSDGSAVPNTHVTKVRASLDDPTWIEVYDPPVSINKTKSYLAQKAHQPDKSIFIWDGMFNSKPENYIAAYCEVYTRKGPYADPLRGEAYGMIGGLTLGVGDVISLPFAIAERIRMSTMYYSKTFWYDTNGLFLGVCNGDIHDLEDQFYGHGRKTLEPIGIGLPIAEEPSLITVRTDRVYGDSAVTDGELSETD